MEINGWRFNTAAFNAVKQKDSSNDQPLSDVLRQWKVDATLPPRFQEAVWRRITSTEAKPAWWHSITSRIEAAFKKPALAVSYVAILLLIGTTAGHRQAHDKSVQSQAHWSALYVQTVDPYQAPRH